MNNTPSHEIQIRILGEILMGMMNFPDQSASGNQYLIRFGEHFGLCVLGDSASDEKVHSLDLVAVPGQLKLNDGDFLIANDQEIALVKTLRYWPVQKPLDIEFPTTPIGLLGEVVNQPVQVEEWENQEEEFAMS